MLHNKNQNLVSRTCLDPVDKQTLIAIRALAHKQGIDPVQFARGFFSIEAPDVFNNLQQLTQSAGDKLLKHLQQTSN